MLDRGSIALYLLYLGIIIGFFIVRSWKRNARHKTTTIAATKLAKVAFIVIAAYIAFGIITILLYASGAFN